jgi:hypothetical protein
MRLIFALSIAFALGVTSTPAFAEDVYTPKVVPSCKVYRTAAGEVCGFLDIADWKTVLKVDAEVVHLREQLRIEAERTANLTLQLTELKSQTTVYANSQSILVQRNGDLTKQLLDLDLKYQKERVKPTWGNPLAWTIAGVSTSILAGVLLAGVLN